MGKDSEKAVVASTSAARTQAKLSFQERIVRSISPGVQFINRYFAVSSFVWFGRGDKKADLLKKRVAITHFWILDTSEN
jgi:hypothetical protein